LTALADLGKRCRARKEAKGSCDGKKADEEATDNVGDGGAEDQGEFVVVMLLLFIALELFLVWRSLAECLGKAGG
jgi:hypothetical protein